LRRSWHAAKLASIDTQHRSDATNPTPMWNVPSPRSRSRLSPSRDLRRKICTSELHFERALSTGTFGSDEGSAATSLNGRCWGRIQVLLAERLERQTILEDEMPHRFARWYK
jgi:hypothetical protein